MRITIDHDWLGYPRPRVEPEPVIARGPCGGWHCSARVCTVCIRIANLRLEAAS